MKLRKLKKLIYHHTDLFFAEDGEAYARSAAAAQKLIDLGRCASFADTLRRAMFRAEMSEQTRAMAARFLKRAEKKERRRQPKAVAIRRSAIAAIALLLFSFFTLVPQGRALAKAFVDWIVAFFSGGVIVEVREHEASSGSFAAEADITFPPVESSVAENVQKDSRNRSVTYTYSSISEFVEATGRNPVILNHPDAELAELVYHVHEGIGIYSLSSVYYCHGQRFFINQTQNDSASITSYHAEAESYFYKKYGEREILCFVDTRDNTANGLFLLENSTVNITTANHPDTWALFDYLAPYQP